MRKQIGGILPVGALFIPPVLCNKRDCRIVQRCVLQPFAVFLPVSLLARLRSSRGQWKTWCLKEREKNGPYSNFLSLWLFDVQFPSREHIGVLQSVSIISLKSAVRSSSANCMWGNKLLPDLLSCNF